MIAPPVVSILHGVSVRSAVPLHAAVPADDRTWDLDLTLLPPGDVPDEPPSGVVAASATIGGRRQYTIADQEGATVVRAHTAAEFRIDGPTDRVAVTAMRSPAFDDEIIGIIFCGTVIAYLLSRRDHLVLHGSAVDLDGLRIGIIGQSGMGKSTLAALLCAAGANLISDDVLPLSIGTSGRVEVLGAVRELRLREKAAGIVDLFADRPPTRITADGRVAVQIAPASCGRLPLDVLLVPRPMRDLRAPVAHRLDGPAALTRLLAFPRILRWHDGEALRAQFERSADVVAQVPVFEVDVPWGPTFRADTALEVVDALRL